MYSRQEFLVELVQEKQKNNETWNTQCHVILRDYNSFREVSSLTICKRTMCICLWQTANLNDPNIYILYSLFLKTVCIFPPVCLNLLKCTREHEYSFKAFLTLDAPYAHNRILLSDKGYKRLLVGNTTMVNTDNM